MPALAGATYTASVTFTDQNGVTLDPGVTTIKVEREDGTELVAAGTATTGTGSAARTYDLTSAHTATVDRLKLTWTGASYGTRVTYVEVRGALVATIADLDALLSRGTSPSDYTAALKLAALEVAADAFEQQANVAFASRYRREKFHAPCGQTLLLPTPQPTELLAVTEAGATVDIDDLDLDTRAGTIFRESGWVATGRRDVEIKWAHGYTTPPADVARAVAMIASSILKDGPWDDRGFGVSTDDGFVRLLTAGVSGAAFSIPEVQAALARWRHRSIG